MAPFGATVSVSPASVVTLPASRRAASERLPFDDVGFEQGPELALPLQQQIVEPLPVERGRERVVGGRQDRDAVCSVQVTGQPRGAHGGLERRHHRDPRQRHVGWVVPE